MLDFSYRFFIIYVCREKKFDSVQIWLHAGSMPDQTNETYYSKNREARRAYQKRYYDKNCQLIRRKRELDTVLDPEKVEAKKLYNRIYYSKNRASIREKRAMLIEKRSRNQVQGAEAE